MKPVDQTVFGHPHGNCFSACVASLLELPIEEVPWFMGPEDWWAGFLEWLRPRGWYAICFTNTDWTCGCYHILSGVSPRGAFDHSVLALGTEIVHDPHPSREGLRSRKDIIVLLPIDPGCMKVPV